MGEHWYQGKFYKTKPEWNVPHAADIRATAKSKANVFSTEVVSYGLELYTLSPESFLRKAPEYYWWIVDNIILPGN